jgi:hypothetical protein
VEYKKGVDNRVVDALSRKEEWDFEVIVSLLSFSTITWGSSIKEIVLY